MKTSVQTLLFALTFLIYAETSAQYRDNTPPVGFVRPSGLVHILDVELANPYAYAGVSGGLWVINIANRSRPTVQGTYRPRGSSATRGGGQIYGLAVNGSVLYACERTNGLEVIDIANPSSPRSLSFYRQSNTHSYEQVLQHDSTLYLAAHEHGVETLDITNPRQPTHQSHTQTTSGMAIDVALSNTHAYVAVDLPITSISQTTEPISHLRLTQRVQ